MVKCCQCNRLLPDNTTNDGVCIICMINKPPTLEGLQLQFDCLQEKYLRLQKEKILLQKEKRLLHKLYSNKEFDYKLKVRKCLSDCSTKLLMNLAPFTVKENGMLPLGFIMAISSGFGKVIYDLNLPMPVDKKNKE